jgi:ubiquinone/menaquinone biosynthesis C-methylase UbiE
MNRVDYYNRTVDYYNRVGNRWGICTLNPFAVESFKYDGDHEKIIAEKANIKDNNLVVLDCGCGFGKTISVLQSKFPTNQYFGITLNLNHVQQKQHENVLLGNFERLDFKNSSVDVVLFIESFNHAFYKQKVLREVFRVLKPNGTLFILDQWIPNQSFCSLCLNLKLRQRYRQHQEFYGAKPVSPNYMMQKAQKTGFLTKSYEKDLNNTIFINKLLLIQQEIMINAVDMVYSDFVFQKPA